MPTLLIEGFNLTLKKGTGIKTYTKALAEVARTLGFDIDVLLQSEIRLNHRDPILAEIAFYEGVKRPNWREKFVRNPLQAAIGAPLGIAATPLGQAGIVLGGEDQIGAFRQRYVSYKFTMVARQHFRRYGKIAALNLPTDPDIFHATQLVPIKVNNAANIYTVHDVIPLRLPSATLDNKKYFLNVLREVCKTADKIVTVSECSKRDILQIVDIPEDKIVVTYQSVHLPQHLLDRSVDETANIVQNIYDLDYNNYYLFFGAVEPKKTLQD